MSFGKKLVQFFCDEQCNIRKSPLKKQFWYFLERTNFYVKESYRKCQWPKFARCKRKVPTKVDSFLPKSTKSKPIYF